MNIIKKLIENKLVVPYYQNDSNYRVIAVFQKMIIDADDDDVEAGTTTLGNGSHSHDDKDKKFESESEKLLTPQKQCCDHHH